MKVIEGSFGKPKEARDSASDVLQGACDEVTLEEESGAELDVICVVFKEGEYLRILGNTQSIDSAYTLLNMASSNLMLGMLSGGVEEE